MGDLIFDHEMHAEEMELECDECHHETNAVPLGLPHEQYFDNFWIDCDTCHHEVGSPNLEARSCYDCHNTKLRDIADERLSPKVILHQNCWTCHEVETGVEASESCELCHSG
jgi:Zn finger protein HypA/HybF involved in hydrogenase expression